MNWKNAFMIKSTNPPKSKHTQKFYDDLMDGKVSRGLWGKSTRFNSVLISKKHSVKKYYVEIIKEIITRNDKVIDYGCGSGGFIISTSPHCKEIIGVEISEKFVIEGNKAIKELGIENGSIVQIMNNQTSFTNGYFDVLIMIDVIHHLESIESTLAEAIRVLKPGGKIIIFEPNKLNPLLALMCLLDRNEWGLLRLGTKNKYRKLFSQMMKITSIQYNGLLIGPEFKIFLKAAELLNRGCFYKYFGWLNPKILIIAQNK